MDASDLLSDGQLEVVARDSFVERESLHSQPLARRSRVTQVHMEDAGPAAILGGLLVAGEGLGWLLKREEWLDDQFRPRQNAEHPRHPRIHTIENSLDGRNNFFASAETRRRIGASLAHGSANVGCPKARDGDRSHCRLGA